MTNPDPRWARVAQTSITSARHAGDLVITLEAFTPNGADQPSRWRVNVGPGLDALWAGEDDKAGRAFDHYSETVDQVLTLVRLGRL